MERGYVVHSSIANRTQLSTTHDAAEYVAYTPRRVCRQPVMSNKNEPREVSLKMVVKLGEAQSDNVDKFLCKHHVKQAEQKYKIEENTYHFKASKT